MNTEHHFFVYSDKDTLPDFNHSKTQLVSIDGKQITSAIKFYTKLNQELTFGSEFGKNLDALFDSMSDLSWLKASDFVILVENSDEFLKDEDEVKIFELFDTLNDIVNAINDEPIFSNQNRTMRFYFDDTDRICTILDESYQMWDYAD